MDIYTREIYLVNMFKEYFEHLSRGVDKLYNKQLMNPFTLEIYFVNVFKEYVEHF